MLEHHSRPSNLSLRHILRDVDLSFEQLAKLCGLSRRQLSYWIKNGFVPPPDEDALSTIEKAALIKDRLERGDTLRQAVRKVADYYEQYRATISSLEEMSDEERGRRLAHEMEELQVQIGRLRQALAEPARQGFALDALTTALHNLALDEILTTLPHSRPSPGLIIRVCQSAGHLRRLLAAPEA